MKAEPTALIYGLGSNLAAERGVSGQCKEIHTNLPDDHKATRVEVKHKVIPCIINLQCQKRRWHVVPHIMAIERKCLRTFVCAYYAFCFVAFPELKISICVLALDPGVDKVLFCLTFHNIFLYSYKWKALAGERGNHISLNLSLRVLEPFHLPSLLYPGVCCTPCLPHTPLFLQQKTQVDYWKEYAICSVQILSTAV